MKKILFVSLLSGCFVGVAGADTVSSEIAKVAATSYVQTAINTRIKATVGTGTQIAKTGSGNVVTSVDIVDDASAVDISATSTHAKKLQMTVSNVQIPVGGQNASSYTPIWVE